MGKNKRIRFSKLVVIYCVIMGTLITGVALGVCWMSGTIPTGTLTSLLAFWGGELLLVCLKCIMGDKTKTPAPQDWDGGPTI